MLNFDLQENLAADSISDMPPRVESKLTTAMEWVRGDRIGWMLVLTLRMGLRLCGIRQIGHWRRKHTQYTLTVYSNPSVAPRVIRREPWSLESRCRHYQ